MQLPYIDDRRMVLYGKVTFLDLETQYSCWSH